MTLKSLNLTTSDIHDNFARSLEQRKPKTQDKKSEKEFTKNKKTRKQGRKIVGKQTSLPARKQGSKEAVRQSNSTKTLINITPDIPDRQRMYRKQTFEFSEEDLEFMDIIKFELRESGVTKNAVVRAGLEAIRKDYQGNKETSFLVRKFTGK